MPTRKLSSPLVSVVMVNWNGLEDTKLCLEHTKKQTYQNFEIIIVDNGSTDNSLEYLRKQKGIILVENSKNLGFTGGHIAGYKASKGEFILLLNNDAVMDKYYIERAINSMVHDSNIGAIGGRAYLWDDNNKLFDRTDHFYAYQNINPITAEGIFEQKDLGELQDVNVVSGSCVMVRRSIVDQVGYLHDPFFAYYEESDLFARMKRAGFRVVYDPSLAIWHANAKTSNKKAPTFSFYMMMRNRFRFAVRNFDKWSLLRFLKFYTKMGVVSIIKSIAPIKQRPMHQAYAKAFLYNLLFGWKAFIERRELRISLDKSDYNQKIVREQTGISVALTCSNKNTLSSYLKLLDKLQPNDELILVTDDPKLAKYTNSLADAPHNLRVCVDRKYFRTHPQNIGAVCAKNEWLILAGNSDIDQLSSRFDTYSKELYYIKRSAKMLSVITNNQNGFSNFENALYGSCSQDLLIERDLFIDEKGLDPEVSITDAKRQVIAYAIMARSLHAISENDSSDLPKYSNKLDTKKLIETIKSKRREAAREHKKPTVIDELTARYYRLAQFQNLISWFFYPRIPVRLKAGRTKNVLLALVKLDRLSFATELKHMRNEVMLYKNSLDVVALKEKELNRLAYTADHPSETLIYIILRDRYETLRQLLDWLKSQNLKKIVFVDNDSKLPPLVDFLRNTDYQVLELGRNMKQTAPWSAGIIKVLSPDDFYVVTDPDIVPISKQPDLVTYLATIHKKYSYHVKVGLGLKIDDLPDHYPLKKQVIQWESQFWKHPLEDGIYEAPVDTTFALYKPHTYRYLLNPSIRTGEPYTARHLPWYVKSDELSDEEVFYRLRLDQDVNTWNKEHLPDKYKKELDRQNS